MNNKIENLVNSWSTGDFLSAAEHPVFRYALETLPIVVDRSGHIIVTNKAFQAASGFSDNELLGKHFCMLYPVEQREVVSAQFHEYWESGSFPSDFVIPLHNPSGKPFYIHWMTHTLTDGHGKCECLVDHGHGRHRAREHPH